MQWPLLKFQMAGCQQWNIEQIVRLWLERTGDINSYAHVQLANQYY
jgi:hypothetical protein